MTDLPRREPWLPHFRRTMGFLRPHWRLLVIGLVAALGVGIFYTFSISSVIPLLKVIFADHETFADWLDREEAQRRLGVVLAADVPDDPNGLSLEHVRPNSPSASVLATGDRILSINGPALSSYAIMQQIAREPLTQIAGVRVQRGTQPPHDVTLKLLPYRGWWNWLRNLAAKLPAGRGPWERLYALGIVMTSLIVISFLGGVCRFFNEGLIATAVQRAVHDLRTQLADHVLRLPLNWYSTHPHGDILGRFATDISKVEVGLSTLFGKTIREPFKAAGVLLLVVLIDWRLLIVALLGLPIGAIVIRTFGRLVKKAQRRASQSWGLLLDHLGERLGGIRVVKASNMQTAESRRFAQEDQTLTKAQTHIELADAATNPALEVLAMGAIALFVLYGGSRVFNQELEPHLFFTAVICLAGIFDPVRKLGNVNNRAQAADASAKRLFELMDLPTEEPGAVRIAHQNPDRKGGVSDTLPPFQKTIEFRDVTFAYPSNPNQNVLENIALRIEKGQTVAVVGPNGSGKTTLISLLLRFYEPTRGQILIDGQNIADVTLESLRAQIGLVTQDAVIFSDTVRDNIAYGANGVADETVQRAARLAHVDDFIQTLQVQDNGHVTRGYDARVNARTLSGGQRQRIALARAILRDPPVLILDEATSQVDSESERKIQEAIEDVTRGRTTFIIAHRFSTIVRSDIIMVLDKGRIVGLGKHEELLASCPLYVTLCQTQFIHAA